MSKNMQYTMLSVILALALASSGCTSTRAYINGMYGYSYEPDGGGRHIQDPAGHKGAVTGWLATAIPEVARLCGSKEVKGREAACNAAMADEYCAYIRKERALSSLSSYLERSNIVGHYEN